MSIEEFEEWWEENGKKDTLCKGWAGEAWQARQPEIDALKAEVHNLHNKLIDAILTRQERDAEITKLQDENAALKAENERLLKDADRLTYLEAHPRLGEIHVDGEVKDCYLYAVSGALGVSLRSIIDALMKETK